MNEMDDEAIEAYNDYKRLEQTVHDNQQLICECNLVSIGDVEDFIAARHTSSVDDIQETLGIGTGCRTCFYRSKDTIKMLLTKVNR